LNERAIVETERSAQEAKRAKRGTPAQHVDGAPPIDQKRDTRRADVGDVSDGCSASQSLQDAAARNAGIAESCIHAMLLGSPQRGARWNIDAARESLAVLHRDKVAARDIELPRGKVRVGRFPTRRVHDIQSA